MFLVNRTNNIVVVSADKIKETKDFFIVGATHYVKLDLALVKTTLPAEYEVGKTTYTADATFNKIGVVDDGTTLGTDTEESEVGEVLKEEADINTEVTAGN